VTLTEFRVGIELADTVARAAEHARVLTAITENVEVLDYTDVTAAAHGRLLAHVRRSGRSRGAQTGRLLLSREARARFGDLPGVVAFEPDPPRRG
jgi:tRNA(fMet)-specific endonuclease VapC